MGGRPDLAPLRRGRRAASCCSCRRCIRRLKGRSNLRDHRKPLIADAAADGALSCACGGSARAE